MNLSLKGVTIIATKKGVTVPEGVNIDAVDSYINSEIAVEVRSKFQDSLSLLPENKRIEALKILSSNENAHKKESSLSKLFKETGIKISAEIITNLIKMGM
jgi:hypothetical protein